MRYVISRMDHPHQIDEASSKAAALEAYKAALKAYPKASIRVLDRKTHTVLEQNYGDGK